MRGVTRRESSARSSYRRGILTSGFAISNLRRLSVQSAQWAAIAAASSPGCGALYGQKGLPPSPEGFFSAAPAGGARLSAQAAESRPDPTRCR